MARYIDADEAKKVINGIDSYFAKFIDDIPTADVVERKKGEWLRYGGDGQPNEQDTVIWQCDECFETYYGRTTRIARFCPNCGARMSND